MGPANPSPEPGPKVKSARRKKASAFRSQECASPGEGIAPQPPAEFPRCSSFKDPRQNQIGVSNRLQGLYVVLREKGRHGRRHRNAPPGPVAADGSEIPDVKKEFSGEFRDRTQPSSRHVTVQVPAGTFQRPARFRHPQDAGDILHDPAILSPDLHLNVPRFGNLKYVFHASYSMTLDNEYCNPPKTPRFGLTK